MVVRVVCGLSATIAIFDPTSAFNSVDLPALGRPRIDTNPERKSAAAPSPCGAASFMGDGLRFTDTHLFHSQLIAGQHLNTNTVTLYAFAWLRDSSQPVRHDPPDGGGLDVALRAKL